MPHADSLSILQIVETDTVFEMIWHIPLNNGLSRISKTERYIRNGEVVEGPRRDGRAGMLRSQLNFTAEGHVHIRSVLSPALCMSLAAVCRAHGGDQSC